MWGRKYTTAELGIRGLPQAANQIQPGQIVAILSRYPAARESLISSLISSNLQTQAIAITLEGSPESLLQLLASASVDAHLACRNDQLFIFTLSTDARQHAETLGPQACIEEFDFFALPSASLILIQGAEQLFTSNSAPRLQQSLKTLRRWALARHHKLIFIFNEEMAADDLRLTLRAQEGALSGLVFLDSDGGHYNWNIDYWTTSEATLSSRAYSLGLAGSGMLLVATGAELDTQDSRVRSAPDQDRVITTIAAIATEKGVPSRWESFGSLPEILLAAEHAVAATVVLEHDSATEFELLLKTVHQLRLKCGRGLKIVIRERTKRMRYTHELLLTEVGASLVVYADVSFSRFLSLLRGLHGQRFGREVETDFEMALSAIMPPQVCGYLPPETFTTTVLETLDRGRAMGLESALTRLTIHPGIPHLDALKACRAKRPGDIFTVDREFLYFFLFACREPDIDATLERLVTAPLGTLFEAEVRYPTYETILPVITGIEQTSGLIDYSALLAEHARHSAPAAPPHDHSNDAEQASKTSTVSLLPAELQPTPNRAPRTAERRPLLLKQQLAL